MERRCDEMQGSPYDWRDITEVMTGDVFLSETRLTLGGDMRTEGTTKRRDMDVSD